MAEDPSIASTPRVLARPVAAWMAIAVAGLTVAVTIRFNTFSPWGSDAASYIESARRWESGRLVAPLPLELWSTWVPHEYAFAPFGFRPGVRRGTEVSTYPIGLPVLMAAAIRVGGELAAYTVPPLCAGLLISCGYLLASWLAGQWAGLLAAALIAASPATLALAIQPMSDVPAAALWALAWVMSLRPGLGASVASGAVVAAAMMVRPNLAPLFFVLLPLAARNPSTRGPGGLRQGHSLRAGPLTSLRAGWRDLVTRDRARWVRACLFVGVAAIGAAVVLWSQAELYGSPFKTGYPTPETYFRVANILPNAEIYYRLLVTVHTPLLLLGWPAAVLLWWHRTDPRRNDRAWALVVSATGFIVLTYALYLPYMQNDTLFSLRFMLPALTALFVLLAAAVTRLAAAAWSRSRLLSVLPLVPALIVALHPANGIRYAVGVHKEQVGLIAAGHYLREALPPNAAIFTMAHGGGLAHYTGRMVVRFDPLPPESLDAIVDDVRRHGFEPVLVLEAGEQSLFQTRFQQSRFQRLDWPPRAEFGDVVRIRYWSFRDRDAYREGRRWATDVVRRSASAMLAGQRQSHTTRLSRRSEAQPRSRLKGAPCTRTSMSASTRPHIPKT